MRVVGDGQKHVDPKRGVGLEALQTASNPNQESLVLTPSLQERGVRVLLLLLKYHKDAISRSRPRRLRAKVNRMGPSLLLWSQKKLY